MERYAVLADDQTFAFSAENPAGERNGGTKGKDCEKLDPTVTIHPGQTAVLADAVGPGIIQNMWFTGYTGHSFILRCFRT